MKDVSKLIDKWQNDESFRQEIRDKRMNSSKDYELEHIKSKNPCGPPRPGGPIFG